MVGKHNPLSKDEIIKIWNDSPTFKAVVARTGLKPETLRTRANKLREESYYLKFFPKTKETIEVKDKKPKQKKWNGSIK